MQQSSTFFRVAALIAGSFFMEMLDGTIISTALPQMARAFGVHPISLNMGMTAYMISLAVFIPISGWMADRFGARTVFASAIGLFTLASGLCGAAHSLPMFIATRILQGLGGAMMTPVGRLIVLRITPKEKLAETMNWLVWPALSALVIGPPLGGFITTYFSWRWIFYINLPMGAAAFVLAWLWIDNDRMGEPTGFDWSSFLFGAGASAGAIYGMELLSGETHRGRGAAMLAASLVCGALTVVLGRRNPERSLIDFASMRMKSFSLSVYGASAFRIAVSVLPFLLPMMYQLAFGMSAFQSGLFLLALFAGDMSMKAFVVPILRRWGFRRVIIVNGFIVAATIMMCALFAPGSPVWAMVVVLVIHGAVRSLQFTALGTLAFDGIAPEAMSRANGFLSTIMQLSSALGVAIGAVTLRMAAQARGGSSLPQLRDFHIAIFVMGVVSLGAVWDCWGLKPEAGAILSGHMPKRDRSEALFDAGPGGD